MAEGVSLGKGAWDCDANEEIPPEKEAEIFEEIATMDYPFEGIPTIPPRKNMTHMAFFSNGCRYRLEAYPDWTGERVKRALYAGGLNRDRPGGKNQGIASWDDIAIIYAGQQIDDASSLENFNVPPGCQTLIAIDKKKLMAGAKPDPDSAYWN